jgi:hypothetical protein
MGLCVSRRERTRQLKSYWLCVLHHTGRYFCNENKNGDDAFSFCENSNERDQKEKNKTVQQ